MHDFLKPSPDQLKREKNKARELRKTAWWKQKLALGECYYCSQKFSAEELTMDHKVPMSRGGKSVKGNVVAACKSCNNEKKYHTVADMIISGKDPYAEK